MSETKQAKRVCIILLSLYIHYQVGKQKKEKKRSVEFMLEVSECHLLQWLWCSLECGQQTKDNLGYYRQCDKIVIIFLWLVAIVSPTCCLSSSHYIYCTDQQWRCFWGDQLFKLLFWPFQTFKFSIGWIVMMSQQKEEKKKKRGWISQTII